MAADFGPGMAETFIVAQAAQWAGDFEHALALYSRIAGIAPLPPGADRVLIPVGREARTRIRDADELLGIAATERYNGLVQKINEFRRIRTNFPPPHQLVGHVPFLLEGKILRGTIWRNAPRLFVMRAYLNDSDAADALKRHAGAASALGERGTETYIEPDEEGVEVIDSGGLNWAVPDNPFISVTYSEAGLIEASAFWTGQTPPAEFVQILRPLRTLFDTLDSPA